MNQCRGTKQGGERCSASVEPPQEYCWWHDPANADKRRRAASRGGKGKANVEVRTVKEELKATIASVKDGSLDRNAGAVAIQGYRALQGYLELERRILETDELQTEIESLKREYGHSA